MFFLVIVQGMSSGRNFATKITLKRRRDVIRLDVPRHVVPPGVGVGAETTRRSPIPRADVLVHELVQINQTRYQH